MGHRATIADVAREAGVSQQTVSRALNNKGEISSRTRARILEIIDRLGYRPSTIARGLVTRRTTTIGFVVPDIANPFFSEIARGAEETAHLAGYSLLLGNTIEDARREEDVISSLEAQRVDGIILCSSRLPEESLVALAARQPAVVLVNRTIESGELRSVIVDDESGAKSAVRHLLGCGRTRIAYLAGPRTSQSGQRRERGCRQALSAAGLLLASSQMISCAPVLEGGRQAAEMAFSAMPGLDALLCYNDLVAVGALQACAALGVRVPEDVAVVGFDDILLAALVTPALTTLRSDQRRLGTMAVRLLLDQLAGCSDGCHDAVIQPELIVRASAPIASAPNTGVPVPVTPVEAEA